MPATYILTSSNVQCQTTSQNKRIVGWGPTWKLEQQHSKLNAARLSMNSKTQTNAGGRQVLYVNFPKPVYKPQHELWTKHQISWNQSTSYIYRHQKHCFTQLEWSFFLSFVTGFIFLMLYLWWKLLAETILSAFWVRASWLWRVFELAKLYLALCLFYQM